MTHDPRKTLISKAIKKFEREIKKFDERTPLVEMSNIMDLVRWVEYRNKSPIEDIVRRLPPRSHVMIGDIDTEFYEIKRDNRVYDVKMPRSRTFDAFLEFSNGDGGDQDMVTYELTPISDLQDAIKSIMITDADSELPSDYHRYILDYLDLRPSTCEFSHIHHPQSSWVRRDSLVKVNCSEIGTMYHGLTTIKIVRYTVFNGDQTTRIDLDFNYGRVQSVLISPIAPKDLSPPIPTDTTLKLTYNNGELQYPLKPWSEIIGYIYGRYSDDYMLELIYKRLEADGLISGGDYRLPPDENRDFHILGYRHYDNRYSIMVKSKNVVQKWVTWIQVDYNERSYRMTMVPKEIAILKGYDDDICIDI